jgi:hypothetical protein
MSGDFAMKPAMRHALLVLLGTAAFASQSTCPVIFAQESKQSENISLQEGMAKVESTLKTEDEKDKVQKNPCRVYLVVFKGGQNYRIDMVSKEIDSYLRLEDATGNELAKDDDGGGLVNARINFTCRMDGAYRVICTTFAGGTGPFTLTIQETPIAAAAELNLKDGRAKVEAKLTVKDATDAVQSRSVCKTYAIKMAKGKSYQIDMMSKDIDSFLRLEDSAGKELAKDDDGGDGRNARIHFECREDGEYRIFATTYFGGTGSFVLTVQEK